MDLLESTTELLGKEFRIFEEKTCPAFDTQELKRELEARQRRQAKNPSTGPAVSVTTVGSNITLKTPITPTVTGLESGPSNLFEAPVISPSNIVPAVSTVTAASSSKTSTDPAPCVSMACSSLATSPIPLLPVVPSTNTIKKSAGLSAKMSRKGKGTTTSERLAGRRKKAFSRKTYKNHSLGDYVRMIRMYGTTDSYSTEGVSLPVLS